MKCIRKLTALKHRIQHDRAREHRTIADLAAEAEVEVIVVGLPYHLDGRLSPNAKAAQIMGGGSAQLNPHYSVSPWDGLAAVFGEERLSYAIGATNHRFEPRLDQRFDVEFYNSADLSGEVVHRGEQFGGEIFLFGYVAPGITDPKVWSARYGTDFTPAYTGEHRVGVA